MKIPQYRLKAIASRIERVVNNADCDYRDLRTINALRLLRGDVAYIQKLLNENNE